MKNQLMEKSDMDLIREIKKGNISAKEALWNRYYQFTCGHYHRDTSGIYKMCEVEFEDYLQEAYLAFENTLSSFDIEKAEKAGVEKFYTYYYYKLLKLRQTFSRYYDKYGHIYHPSEIHNACRAVYSRDEVEDNLDDPWNEATSRSVERDIEQESARQVVNAYLREAQPLHRAVVELMLEGATERSLAEVLGPEGYDSLAKVRKLLKVIRKELEAVSERVAFA